MVLIICTKNESNLTNRYWDMVPDRQKVLRDRMDGRTQGWRQNYIPPTSSEDNNMKRGSYMSAHVLLNLLKELGKRDKMQGLQSILSLFCNSFNKFNNTGGRMLDDI